MEGSGDEVGVGHDREQSGWGQRGLDRGEEG